jgi:large subunit ribosomal protein L17
MRHGKALRKLGRTTAHRMSLLRNLSTSFFDKERIRTTLPKAKELRPFAERLITLARRDTLHSRRLVARSIQDRAVVKKLFDTLGPRFAQRPGGYSRILKLGWREGDGAEMAILELLGSEPVFDKGDKKGKKGKRRKKAAPAAEAAAGTTAGEAAGHDHEHGEDSPHEEGEEKAKGSGKKDAGRSEKGGKAAKAPRGKKKPA